MDIKELRKAMHDAEEICDDKYLDYLAASDAYDYANKFHNDARHALDDALKEQRHVRHQI